MLSSMAIDSMLVLRTNEYDPDDTETLLAAFRILDQENKGYIECDMMRSFL